MSDNYLLLLHAQHRARAQQKLIAALKAENELLRARLRITEARVSIDTAPALRYLRQAE